MTNPSGHSDAKEVISLPQGKTLTITSLANNNLGTIKLESKISGLYTTTTNNVALQTYGPYGMDMVITLSVSSKGLNYIINDVISPAYSFDSSGNVTGLVGPSSVNVINIAKQTAIPVFLQSSGTIGNNGALSALTALPTTYTSIYLYFPVNTIAAGVAAGLYYCVMSSTTAGTIYNNVYDPSLGVLPTIPASPTAFVTTGPGAYTQTTGSPITLVGLTIVGGSMGPSGSLFSYPEWVHTSSANNKWVLTQFGGSSAGGILNSTTSGLFNAPTLIRNRANVALQVTNNYAGLASSNAIPLYLTKNTAGDVLLTYVTQLAVATEYCGLEGASVVINFT